MHLPQFIRAANLASWENWIFKLDIVFDAVGCLEARRVPIAQYFLPKEAIIWWQAVKPQDHAASWDESKNLMGVEFCQYMRAELTRLVCTTLKKYQDNVMAYGLLCSAIDATTEQKK